MICPYCRQSHPANARFCPATGDSLRRTPSTLPFLVMGFIGLVLIIVGAWLLLDWSGIRIFKTGSESPIDAQVESTLALAESSMSASQSVVTPIPDSYATYAAQTVTARLMQTALGISITPLPTEIPSQTSTPTTGFWQACPDAPPSRLQVGERAYVSYEPPLPNRVREYPGTHSKVLGRIQPSEEVSILEGPGCANNWVWWRIRSEETGLTGWTAEGDHKDYWLIPIP
jgi:hypothetical protein